MNRTDRLLAMVLELEAQGWRRAEDLAARFEVTKRTVYRDMQALSEAAAGVHPDGAVMLLGAIPAHRCRSAHLSAPI